MISLRTAAAIAACIVAAGCASSTPATVAEPPKITLTDALTDVVAALNAARAKSETYPEQIGLNPCSVTAVFDVAAKATDSGTYTLGVSAGPPGIPVSVNAGGEWSQAAEGTRGNQVTVVLMNPSCLPGGSLGATKPDQIVQAQDQITRARGAGSYLLTRPGPSLRRQGPAQPSGRSPDQTVR